MRKLTFIIILLIASHTIFAQYIKEFALPSLISDHAVMQRDSEVRLWGWCPGELDLKIVCSWQPNDTVKVKSDRYCQWETFVKTPKEEGPYSIQFYDWWDRPVYEVNDILMGETWLCSGQSNMDYMMQYTVSDAGDITEMLQNKKIRFFKVDKTTSRYPAERVQGKWEICTSETYLDFSAPAFFFGQKLNETLQTPIGLIGATWGGTAIEPWIDEFMYGHEEELLTLSQKYQLPGWSPTGNSAIFNGMINPLSKYTIAGVIWYQGEANNERASDYGKLFDGMIRGWRKAFQTYLPFYFVQIAPWNGYADRNAAYLREQQDSIAKTLRNTGMIVVADLVNDVSDIHPSMKRQVGERLADMALNRTYGYDMIHAFYPQLDSIRIKGNKVYVSIKSLAGLNAKEKSINHFELIDADDNIFDADAQLLKNGEICVTSKQVKSPVAVRYCFTNDAIPDLFDNNGLPLAPFRTDRIK